MTWWKVCKYRKRFNFYTIVVYVYFYVINIFKRVKSCFPPLWSTTELLHGNQNKEASEHQLSRLLSFPQQHPLHRFGINKAEQTRKNDACNDMSLWSRPVWMFSEWSRHANVRMLIPRARLCCWVLFNKRQLEIKPISSFFFFSRALCWMQVRHW